MCPQSSTAFPPHRLRMIASAQVSVDAARGGVALNSDQSGNIESSRTRKKLPQHAVPKGLAGANTGGDKQTSEADGWV